MVDLCPQQAHPFAPSLCVSLSVLLLLPRWESLQTRLDHPVAHHGARAGQQPCVPPRVQPVDPHPPLPEPQGPVQMYPALLSRQPYARDPCVHPRGQTHRGCLPELVPAAAPGIRPPLPAPVTPAAARSPHPASHPEYRHHRDPSWHATHEEEKQAETSGDATTLLSETYPSDSRLHSAAQEQIPRVPAREPCRRGQHTQVSGVSGCSGVAEARELLLRGSRKQTVVCVSVGLVNGSWLCAVCSGKVGWEEFSGAGNYSSQDGL